jgi:hypothetical protein
LRRVGFGLALTRSGIIDGFCTSLARSSGSLIARDIARGTGGFSGFGVGGRWQAASSRLASSDVDRIRMRMAALRGGRMGKCRIPGRALP